MSGMVVFGSNASTTSCEQPVIIAVYNQVMPPMWVNGNTIALRSSEVIASARFMPFDDAFTVASVCCAPLGSAVVPDV